MCYNCQICNATSEPGEPLQVHRVYRHIPYSPSEKKVWNIANLSNPTRTEIAREIPVCNDCMILIMGGIPLHMILRQKGNRMGTCDPILQQPRYHNKSKRYQSDKNKRFLEQYGKSDTVMNK